MFQTKYIRTQRNEIICFPDTIVHSEFSDFKPVSAGFIIIDTNQLTGEPICKCYGESVSLGLKSLDEDSALAKRQILQIR